MDVGLLILRVAVGVLFAAHGAQKLFGWFGGYGIKGTGGFFEQIGYRPGPLMALVAGASEFGGGLMLAAGVLTPLAAAAIIGVMINAIFTVKRKVGLIATGGYEVDTLYALTAASVAFTGPGTYSLDHALGWSLAGWEWGAGAIALGVVTALLTLASRRVPAAVTRVETQAA